MIDRLTKIRREVFDIFLDAKLRSQLQIKFIWNDQLQIQVTLMHKIKATNEQKSQTIVVKFGLDYPKEPPSLRFKDESLPEIFLMSEDLYRENWNPEKNLKDYMLDIYQMIDNYLSNEAEFKSNQNKKIDDEKQKQRESEEDNSEETEKNKIKLLLNGAENEISQTKNLNRHFKSKLKEILKEMKRYYPTSEDSTLIEQIFSDHQVGFEEIRKALSNRWFNEEIKWQMKNGKFLNRIMRGMMGIRSKKLMIKYYHVMIAAVQNPETFVCWKYDQ